MDRKTKIIISSVVVLSITTYIIINRSKKRKLYKQLMAKLETGEGSGVISQEIDGLTKKGSALDPTYWRTVEAKYILTTANATAKADAIRKLIHGTFGTSDEEGLLEYVQKIPSKAIVSEIAEIYQKKYGISLANDIKTIDNSILGAQNWLKTQDLWSVKIASAIRSLPDK